MQHEDDLSDDHIMDPAVRAFCVSGKRKLTPLKLRCQLVDGMVSFLVSVHEQLVDGIERSLAGHEDLAAIQTAVERTTAPGRLISHQLVLA